MTKFTIQQKAHSRAIHKYHFAVLKASEKVLTSKIHAQVKQYIQHHLSARCL